MTTTESTNQTTTRRQDMVAEIAEWSAYRLANEANCGGPDGSESEGAQMLTRVRDNTLEALEGVELDDIDRLDDDGALHQIADGAPSIYTFTKWQQFVDLAAYQEDVSELSGDTGDMDQLGGIALYMIAERLVNAIVEQVTEAAQEDADEATEEDETDEDD